MVNLYRNGPNGSLPTKHVYFNIYHFVEGGYAVVSVCLCQIVTQVSCGKTC